MKFLLQIEVDIPEDTEIPDFPRAAHGIQRLADWLKDAKEVQHNYFMDTFGTECSTTDAARLDAYRAAVKQEIRLITSAIQTIKEPG